MHEMKAEREALETKGREIIEKRDELKAEEQKGKSFNGYSTFVEYKKYKRPWKASPFQMKLD